ncbi:MULTISPECIES: tRNA (adenosine(37)-N6)-dimethylallyltransferase MiaA [unclassified Gemella]|uniref:tRNA (adenosine(37)-N6)-dimethylallyltransferase MiaA n=1 Tax=unclassified Gemella TaxID=2624949 RepID=UPI001C03DE76|nr:MULTISPECIES: tRNA (adenosine(37)-N6)-dimethylallyltransferase MiaA [unclassified Gemella]MBU0278303.1 tRNA (adenosine(37)-N6)-dimethylallyltransferase MiaA [Gemella sp. zg-1178]QWQ38191.1 tRNA (adenosine(37)-N6)-dimethylallyltransferase MiaA [Gemella sp. zg-570]
MNIPVIAIVGATSVGKTNLSIELAKKFNCEIISVDSVQIYRDFNIGSAKIKEEEMQGIKHHLIDELDPIENLSVYEFQNLARRKIEEVYSRGKIPLLVGGTGYYMNAILYNYEFSNYNKDFNIDNISLEEMLQYLKENFLETYEKIDKKNMRRIVNAYKYAIYESKSLIENNKGTEIYYRYNPHIIVLNREREIIYNRINVRVNIMLKEGLVEEVKSIINKYGNKLQALNSIGYKEVVNYLNNNQNLEFLEEDIAKNSRRFAKRQITWFRNKMPDTHWYNIDNIEEIESIYPDVENFLMVKNNENN